MIDDPSKRKAAFSDLVRQHYNDLFSFALGYLRSPQEAEDVIQDVLLNVWERREDLLDQPSLKGYLYRAVRNRALNALRDAKTGGDVQIGVSAHTIQDDDLPYRELVRDYRAAVDALPERQREAFRLSRLYGLTYREIGEVMDTSINTVRTQIASALAHLRERLADHL